MKFAGKKAFVFNKAISVVATITLSSCALVQYQPTQTINKVDLNSGYRLQKAFDNKRTSNDDMLVILMLSGGGTRAAALGYGVMEQLQKQQIPVKGKEVPFLSQVDVVYGVSGGSVLAAYFSMYGKDTIPSFEQRFLKQNFQHQVAKQVFSAANLPRLTSSQFGRGDLLQEQFEGSLFRNTTFGDLAAHRKGPFAVISATDMSIGNRIDFTQEYFDSMCLNLSSLKIARAVAASSAVPLVFAPITLNNNGGNCGYSLPRAIKQVELEKEGKLTDQDRTAFSENFKQYENSRERPYIHLLDGGLTDNLGLRSLLDTAEVYPKNLLEEQLNSSSIKKVVIINVNAQNQVSSDIDKTADIPGMRAVAGAIVDIPIDKYSQESLRRFRQFVDKWNDQKISPDKKVGMYFVSLNLRDLPKSQLRDDALNISTSFYLPRNDINNLKSAAKVLLSRSSEYKRLLNDLDAGRSVVQPTDADLVWPAAGKEPVAAAASEEQQDYSNLLQSASQPK